MKKLARYLLYLILFIVFVFVVFAVINLSITLMMTGEVDIHGDSGLNQMGILVSGFIAWMIVGKINNSKLWIRLFNHKDIS